MSVNPIFGLSLDGGMRALAGLVSRNARQRHRGPMARGLPAQLDAHLAAGRQHLARFRALLGHVGRLALCALDLAESAARLLQLLAVQFGDDAGGIGEAVGDHGRAGAPTAVTLTSAAPGVEPGGADAVIWVSESIAKCDAVGPNLTALTPAKSWPGPDPFQTSGPCDGLLRFSRHTLGRVPARIELLPDSHCPRMAVPGPRGQQQQ